jgi:NADPH-dependent 2,4-dienoyl-CoA reductase/sulfur reductase-like enzyme
MKKVVIVGGGVAAKGFVNASMALHDDIEYTIVRSNARGPVPCGIPYAFGTLKDPNENVSSDKKLLDNGVHLIIDDVIAVDKTNKVLTLKSKPEVRYDYLVMATGSTPVFPPFKGRDLKGIHVIEKDLDKVVALKTEVEKANSIVIVGGGFIGVELADEINKMGGKEITLVELAPHCLNVAFESEISVKIESSLVEQGINILTGTAVESFEGDGSVKTVVLNNGDTLNADIVFLAIGAYPNIDLAKTCELNADPKAGIIVNEYQETSESHIFAIGDCASKKDLFTNKNSNIRLASIAAKEARNAAFNLLGQRRMFSPVGITNLFSTAIEGHVYAAAGMTKDQCISSGYDVVEVKLSSTNKHPIKLPDAVKTDGIFFFDKKELLLLGAQLVGNMQASETINAIGIAIQNGATAYDLYGYNYGTHPLGTASPNLYLLHQAGLRAMSK